MWLEKMKDRKQLSVDVDLNATQDRTQWQRMVDELKGPFVLHNDRLMIYH